MKKNISINIGGIIFHIEEDGFDKLRNYLDSINTYFSNFEDSKEIIEDIESRIAEIFLSKLNEVNQVISIPDVEEVIATMGTTQDFDATIENESASEQIVESKDEESKSEETEEPKEEDKEQEDREETRGPKRLSRHKYKKVIGGVAAGIAHYLQIDALWVRLVFLLLLINIFLGGLSGFIFITYIVLWIVLPADDLEEDKKVKKLFRDTEKSVIAGVSSGIASYFGVDRAVIRLLFVLSFFLGGTGFILYIVLWIITPAAKTITERMQMEGEPVTLSNIEENVKKRLNEEDGKESPLASVLLFPFRLIGTIIRGIGKALGPAAMVLVEILRVFAGFMIIIVGFGMIIGFSAAFLILVGFAPEWWSEYVRMGDFPLGIASSSVSFLAIFFAFLIAFVPALAITLAGVMVMSKRRVGSNYLGWSLFGLWIVGIAGTAIFLPAVIKEFDVRGSFKETKEFPLTAETPTLRLNEVWYNTDYDPVDLRLRGTEDSVYRLELRFEAKGSDREDAQANAEIVDYNVTKNGDDIIFDSNLTFPDRAKFRFQQVDATFYIPEGKVFRMERDLNEILSNTVYRSGYRSYQIEENDWVFENGRLKCASCEEEKDRRSSSLDRVITDDDIKPRQRGAVTSNVFRDWERVRGEEVSYNFAGFNEVRVSSKFRVFIEQGDEYEVMLKGNERDLDDIYIRRNGNSLQVKHRDHEWGWWDPDTWKDDIALYVKMPNLEGLDLSGACKAKIAGFKEGDLEIELTGASEIDANISPDYLTLDLVGASKVTLDGEARKVKVDMAGASKIKAYDFRAEIMELYLAGASSAKVYVTEELKVDASGVSTVTYKGRPDVQADEHGLSSIKRY